MPKTLIKSRLHSNKHKPKINQEINTTKSNLPRNLQLFKQKLLTGNGFIKFNWFFLKYKYFYKHDYMTIYHNREIIKQFRSKDWTY